MCERLERILAVTQLEIVNKPEVRNSVLDFPAIGNYACFDQPIDLFARLSARGYSR
jgi:hypothetical protein